MRTLRQRRGARGEEIAIGWLQERQWRVIARNVRIGAHDEIDVVAIDPGPPMELVCVEVRSATSSAFGAPEERLVRAKVGRLYRSMRAADLPVGLPRRVDLIVVDARGASVVVRHIPRLEPV